MSTKSELREKFGPRVRIRAIDRVPYGSPARYVLTAEQSFHRTVTATESLAKRGLTLLQAKRSATRLANGQSIAVEIPKVEDRESFERELRRIGIVAELRDLAGGEGYVGAGTVDRGDAGAHQELVILRRDDAAADHEDVVAAFLAQCLQERRHQRLVAGRLGGDTDHMDVVLHRLARGFLGRLEQRAHVDI